MGLVAGTDGVKGHTSLDTVSANQNFIIDYFGRSVVLFRDDEGFMRELKILLERDLPEEIKL